MVMQKERELLTAAQVAERFQVHPETARRWLRDNGVHPVHVGRGSTCARYRLASIERAERDLEAAAAPKQRKDKVTPIRRARKSRAPTIEECKADLRSTP